MQLMLSDLIEAATAEYEEHGDMPVNIDNGEESFERMALEMRREVDIETKKYNFTIADYIYEPVKLKLIKG